MTYSRSATVGASLEARRAGNHVASTLATPSPPMASANDVASIGDNPYSSTAAYRSVTAASATAAAGATSVMARVSARVRDAAGTSERSTIRKSGGGMLSCDTAR